MYLVRVLTIAALISLGTSCSLVKKGEQLLDDGRALLGEFKTEYDRVRGGLKEASAQADANKDGKTTIPEWAIWLTTGGGAAFIAALIRNGKSNERKARNEGKTERLDERLKGLESALAKGGSVLRAPAP